MPKINVDIDPDNFLPVYQPTIGSTNDIEFLYGSRDSGKSRHIAQILVTICLALPKFKCPLIRKVQNTVKDSQWTMIKEVVEEWKLDHLFKFTTSPLEIKCKSGGVFLARGLDDAKKIKSLTNPSHAWIEEGADITSDDWTIITTSLRSNHYKTQIWFSFNPDIPGIYEDFWLYQRYFAHHKELTFTDKITETLQDGEEVNITYRATHSTFYDNRYCPGTRKAYYEGLAKTSEYEHRVYCLGLWGVRKTGGEFLKRFQSNIHVNRRLQYNPMFPLFFSLDNNVYPYCAVGVWQLIPEEIDGGTIWFARQIAELPAVDPDNSAAGAAKLIIKYLHQLKYYEMTVHICGDRSTKNQSTIDPLKRSFFQIVNEAVTSADFRTKDCFLAYSPAPPGIADFANAIFNNEIPGLQIEIGNCPESIKDYIITKADRNGNILKINKADYEGGPSYQHNGHFTDTLKDMIVQAFYDQYIAYTNRHKTIQPGGVSKVNRVSNITG